MPKFMLMYVGSGAGWGRMTPDESKEQIGGYAIVDVADREAVIEIARTSPFLETMEIRPIVETRD